jgi:hypothetical protein
MNTERPVEDRIRSWLLVTAPTELPDRVFDATFERTQSMSQASGVRVWRTLSMNALPRTAVAVIAIVLVVGTGAYLLGPGGLTGGSPANPTPAATPSPTPLVTTLADATSSPASSTFTSAEYGYSVDVPATWIVTPAKAPWPGAVHLDEDAAVADSFVLQGSPDGASVSVKAHAVPTGTTATAWLADWERAFEVGGHCFGSATPWTDATVAGVPARRLEWRCDSVTDAKSNYDVYAFVTGGTGYVVAGTPSMVALAVQSFRAP